MRTLMPLAPARPSSLCLGLIASSTWLVVGCSSAHTAQGAGAHDAGAHAAHPAYHDHQGAHDRHGHEDGAARAPGESRDARDELARVAAVHGGNGPWAVAGYRMGKHALGKLGLAPYSFDLEVVHRSPRAVQFTCVADGAAAATGASLGKLNLSLVESDEAHTVTTYRRRSSGQSISLRVTPAFVARFKEVPREKLGEAGQIVIGLPDAEIFEEAR